MVLNEQACVAHHLAARHAAGRLQARLASRSGENVWASVELSFSRRGSGMGCCWGGVANPREWALPNAAAGPLERTQNPLIVKAPPLRWPVKAPPPVLLAKGAAPKAALLPGADLHKPRPPVKAPPVGYAAALPRQE